MFGVASGLRFPARNQLFLSEIVGKVIQLKAVLHFPGGLCVQNDAEKLNQRALIDALEDGLGFAIRN